jgi:membrane protease YdiL (CAAX protease family)
MGFAGSGSAQQRRRKPPPKTQARVRPTGYAALSTRPLHNFLLLLPLVGAYEVGSILYLTEPSGEAKQILAQRLLGQFFELFWVGGLYLPALALLVVLLLWHILERDPWRVRPAVLLGMLIESLIWTLPLVVLAHLVALAASAGDAPPAAALTLLASDTADTIRAMPWQARATIAVGAGLYEELLFRMVAIALLHFLFVDLLGVKETPGRVVAIVLSALLFAVYHADPAGLPFYLMAGLYFGAIYVWRGFGIAVATHALYDLVALLLLSGA